LFKTINEAKFGLWQTLASKAKEILNEDGLAPKFEDLGNNRCIQKISGEAASISEYLNILAVTNELFVYGIVSLFIKIVPGFLFL
jgi:hypothetical protein